MNALFLKDLSAKTHRGLRGRVEAGKSGGGICCGYDVVKLHDDAGEPIRGERSIDEAEAEIVRRKVERLSEALADPRDRDGAAEAIRGLIERIVLTPGAKRGEMHAALHGDLGTIIEWAGSGTGRKGTGTDTPRSGMSVPVVAGGRRAEYAMSGRSS